MFGFGKKEKTYMVELTEKELQILMNTMSPSEKREFEKRQKKARDKAYDDGFIDGFIIGG